MSKVSIINEENLGVVDEDFEYDSMDELAAVLSNDCWSPGIFNDRKRNILSLASLDLLVLDVDDGASLDDAKEKFSAYKHIIATSKSHQKEKNGKVCDRFRVVLFLTEPITNDKDFKVTWTFAYQQWPFIDRACKDSARFFYPSPNIVSINRTGQLVQTRHAPVMPTIEPKARAAEAVLTSLKGERVKGDLWKSTLEFLLEGAPEGTRHNALVKAVGNMREQGYEKSEVIEKLQNMIDIGGSWTSTVTKTDLKTIDRMFAREMKYEFTPKVADLISNELGNENNTGVVVNASDLLDEAFAYLSDKDKVKGDPTGIEGLDRLLGGGFRTGELTVLMAQAKTGKNTLYHYLMYKHLQLGTPFGYASRELNPASEVIPNLLSIALGVNAWTINIDDSFKDRSRNLLSKWELYFAPGYGYFPIHEMESWFRSLKAKGINHFLFDHFHYALMKEDHDSTSLLIRKLKQLAKELDIHLSLIVQPRGLREGEQLSLATLRGGAVIGQALDNLLILERVKNEQNISKLTLEVARHKLARLGHIYLKYDNDTTSFEEVDRQLVTETTVPYGADPKGKYGNNRKWPNLNSN